MIVNIVQLGLKLYSFLHSRKFNKRCCMIFKMYNNVRKI